MKTVFSLLTLFFVTVSALTKAKPVAILQKSEAEKLDSAINYYRRNTIITLQVAQHHLDNTDSSFIKPSE